MHLTFCCRLALPYTFTLHCFVDANCLIGERNVFHLQTAQFTNAKSGKQSYEYASSLPVQMHIEDPRGQFEEKVVGEVQMEQFKRGMTERDKTILQMRFEGYSLQEIADKVGFKTASAVSKRIEKIAGNLEKFLGDEYKTFLNKYTR